MSDQGGSLICLCGVFGIELASVGVDRLIHVDYFRGSVELKYEGFAAILHLSEPSLN